MRWRAMVSCLAVAVRIAFALQATASFLDVADATTMNFFFAWVD
jgi:hypothetical protein